jgi:hypothetical protein
MSALPPGASPVTRNGNHDARGETTAAADGLPRTTGTFNQSQQAELESLVARAGEVAGLLGEIRSDDVEQALAVIFTARSQLDETERQLVRLALKGGRSWARIGVALGIQSGRATRDQFGGTGGSR